MNNRRFQGLSAAGRSLLSGYPVDPSEEAETCDSDDDNLPSVEEIIARSKQVINLTLDNNGDSDDDNNIIEVSWLRIIRTARPNVALIPPALIDRIQLADLLLSHSTILVAKVTRTHRRRAHSFTCSGHTY